MDKKILLIGDFCVDEFIYGVTKRKSPEGDGLVFNPIKTVISDGMGGHVKKHLERFAYSPDTLFPRSSIKKIRYLNIETNQLYLRVDMNDKIDERINREELKNIKEYDAVIISDYCKGFLRTDDINFISQKNENCFLDTKKQFGDWCKHLKFIKINREEYAKNSIFIRNNDWMENKIIQTLDSDGAKYRNKVFSTEKINNPDVVGAGDAFFASFFVKFLETNNIDASIRFAVDYSHGFINDKKDQWKK